MNVDVAYRPAHALARVALENGESIMAESGAMVGMSTNIQMTANAGGVLQGIKRVIGGESFFRTTFTAQGAGEVLLAHSLCGDIAPLDVGPTGYFIQSSAYIASSAHVDMQTKLGGFRTFFAGEGLFVLRVTAPTPGKVLVGAFGGLETLTCDGNLLIDTGHLVAWDANLEYSVRKSASGWIASFLSGEGLICHFRGNGRIWIQSRNPAEYGQKVGRLLPPRRQ